MDFGDVLYIDLTGLADLGEGGEGMAGNEGVQVSSFNSWVGGTEMERLEEKLVWERIKSQKCMKFLSKKEE